MFLLEGVVQAGQEGGVAEPALHVPLQDLLHLGITFIEVLIEPFRPIKYSLQSHLLLVGFVIEII